MAEGGMVTSLTAALVTERGPDVVPLSQAALSGELQVHLHGTVLGDRRTLDRELEAAFQSLRAQGRLYWFR
jgi:hypothetical protein